MKKIKLNLLIKLFLIQILIILTSSSKAFAYIGLGPLLPVIGSVIVYVFIGIISILGIIVYPLRKIVKKINNKKQKETLEKFREIENDKSNPSNK